jgi:hypothetical protein
VVERCFSSLHLKASSRVLEQCLLSGDSARHLPSRSLT